MSVSISSVLHEEWVIFFNSLKSLINIMKVRYKVVCNTEGQVKISKKDF